MAEFLSDVEVCVDRALAAVGNDLVVASPLGLGKPVQLLNAFYRRALARPELSLHIVTALCLEVPRPAPGVEASLAGPIMERLFGDYEELAFMAPLREGRLPPNVRISELYMRAGAMKGVPAAQQNYISSNYTHIARDMVGLGVNVLAQMVALREGAGGPSLSLSCNPDVTPELMRRLEAGGSAGKVVRLAQVHPDLPFMEHDAEVPPESFDYILRNPDLDRALFAVPNGAVPPRDYAAALHAASLVPDGGTLQIGIGALGDALARALILRQRDGEAFRHLLEALAGPALPVQMTGSFQRGLYVCTEMFVNGMLHLIREGVVKRRVYDCLPLQEALNAGVIDECVDARMLDHILDSGMAPARLDAASLAELQYWGIVPRHWRLAGDQLLDGEVPHANDLRDAQTRDALVAEGARLRNGRCLHGGFFLGPRDFYQSLRELDAEDRERICMTGVERTNQLLGDVSLYTAQRRDARFINTGMMVTLSGAVVSDALEDGTVISGVGGQYNFVAMANDLDGARSILCIRSTREHGGKVHSNIVPNYGHTTIPRHLRDIVVTEYGIADLRGRSDAEIIKRLLAVADSRFQEELLAWAQARGKVEAGYQLPPTVRSNTPGRLEKTLAAHADLLPDYPFGTELTDAEIALSASLRRVRAMADDPGRMLATAFRALLHREDEEAARPWLERIELEHPATPREFLIQQLLLLDLEEKGLLKVS